MCVCVCFLKRSMVKVCVCMCMFVCSFMHVSTNCRDVFVYGYGLRSRFIISCCSNKDNRVQCLWYKATAKRSNMVKCSQCEQCTQLLHFHICPLESFRYPCFSLLHIRPAITVFFQLSTCKNCNQPHNSGKSNFMFKKQQSSKHKSHH